jgi:hypothetical protein
MGLGDWWRRLMKREDVQAIERTEEEQNETLDERRYTSGDIAGLEDDQFAARAEHEPNIEDAERLGEGDE